MSEADRKNSDTRPKAGTGIAGLDEVLRGGLSRDRLYVVEGNPGAGKTTLALQFLLEGVRVGERVLYVTLSETAEELHEVAESHGWSLEGIDLVELDSLSSETDYTIFHPADVELSETTKRVREEVERVNPSRVALDSVSELKILSQTLARYRREFLGLKQFFIGKRCTVLVLDDRTGTDNERQLQSIAHGVISLDRQMREYGNTRRQIRIVKMRGVRFVDGLHDFVIKKGGLEVYPRLCTATETLQTEQSVVLSGVEPLDRLLGNGLERGSSTLVLGPAGCGKTTIASQYMLAALERGEPVTAFLFDEGRAGFLQRATGLGMHFEKHAESGLLDLSQMDPADLSPGEFARWVADAVEKRHARMVVIDSLNGFVNAMPSEQFLLIQMHELLMYLANRGVATILVMAQHGVLGAGMQTPVDVSFLADTVILLRYFEAMGEVKLAISVLKKRRSGHERTIREMQLGPGGVQIGEPLRAFEGVLTGVPRYRGSDQTLLKPDM